MNRLNFYISFHQLLVISTFYAFSQINFFYVCGWKLNYLLVKLPEFLEKRGVRASASWTRNILEEWFHFSSCIDYIAQTEDYVYYPEKGRNPEFPYSSLSLTSGDPCTIMEWDETTKNSTLNQVAYSCTTNNVFSVHGPPFTRLPFTPLWMDYRLEIPIDFFSTNPTYTLLVLLYVS